MVIEKLAFALQQYALLGIFAVSAFGLGGLFTRWIPVSLPPEITVPLKLAGGVGAIMVVLFLAGNLHRFSAPVIVGLVALGLSLAVFQWLRKAQGQSGRNDPLARSRWIPAGAWPWLALLTAVSLPLLVKPLQPPMDWDELAYHLPYARFWAEQGSLAVNEWLRFPLFTYNMELLYGAALVFGNDVLPHLLHAFTAAMTAVLTFGLARRYIDWRTGVVAVILLLFATRWGWSTANVDFGVMLFWTSSFAALALRHEFREVRFTYLSMFFAGMAVGIKYQALLFIPVFAVLILMLERRPAVLARAGLIFMATGGYWYVRNYLISGNPVHPVGSQWMGYWLWSADDLAGLNSDLDGRRDWPPWYLLCFAGAALYWRTATIVHRITLFTATAAVVTWAMISAYPRYLIGVFPLLAILSALFFVESLRRTGLVSRTATLWRKPDRKLRLALLGLFYLATALGAYLDVSKNWEEMAPGEDSRSILLTQHFAGYELLMSLDSPPTGTIYQLGFEGELYHLGPSVRGDWFGPGRYSDVMSLSQDAPALARHLAELGADGLLVNLVRKPFSEQFWDPLMLDYFELIGQSNRAALYQLRPPFRPEAIE